MIHQEGIIINDFAMDWHRGVYEAYATLAGATDVKITKKKVDDSVDNVFLGKSIWDFEITYKNTPLSEISNYLSNTISGVPRDIDRGLAITSQIRD